MSRSELFLNGSIVDYNHPLARKSLKKGFFGAIYSVDFMAVRFVEEIL
jgi:hypothetical protein